ncbi:hypothetical protein [Oceanisphaera arctica]|uniref:Uncharacterized protein n=1 Tax=Oceanisphaera arctica TaxID=641510 RepID=A0A2P5TIC6_9GAMM|nr:hypothetical protein [Oceanisphaera arctica]PPL14466.1 hypothetical protein UN63_15665 [Oceanisphaera arctica]GHA10565.1 hypothetical protein GCM10007082_09330 [Oceanisphaera arctica]
MDILLSLLKVIVILIFALPLFFALLGLALEIIGGILRFIWGVFELIFNLGQNDDYDGILSKKSETINQSQSVESNILKAESGEPTPEPKDNLILFNPPPQQPFRKTVSQSNRTKNTSFKSKVNWRSQGLLSLSGYHVGKSKGVKTTRRRQILDDLLLYDPLDDVADRVYAAEWGVPSSSARYIKITDSISSFMHGAKARASNGGPDLGQAIAEWNMDLDYLHQQYGARLSSRRSARRTGRGRYRRSRY